MIEKTERKKKDGGVDDAVVFSVMRVLRVSTSTSYREESKSSGRPHRLLLPASDPPRAPGRHRTILGDRNPFSACDLMPCSVATNQV